MNQYAVRLLEDARASLVHAEYKYRVAEQETSADAVQDLLDAVDVLIREEYARD